eukprot:gene10141-11224_t
MEWLESASAFEGEEDSEEIEDYIIRFLSNWSTSVDLLWVLMILGALLAGLPQLSFVGTHGKRASSSARQDFYSIWSMPVNWQSFVDMTVPKKTFRHFYVLGSSASAVLLLWMYLRPYPVKTLAAVLFFLHCLRRLWECYYLTEFGDSSMHVSGYLVGMVHYLLVPVTLLIAACEEKVSRTRHYLVLGLRKKDEKRATVVIALYLLATLLQFFSHRTLYYLKKRKIKEEKEGSSGQQGSQQLYILPSGGGFDYCSCPHYLAEIGIYLSLTIATYKCKTSYYLFLWVLANLSVVAYKQYSWYLEKFPDEVLEKNWYILFPFVW